VSAHREIVSPVAAGRPEKNRGEGEATRNMSKKMRLLRGKTPRTNGMGAGYMEFASENLRYTKKISYNL
jgi:hypothetical protein